MGLAAISVDSREESVAFAGKLSITFPLLADPGVKVALAYGVAMQGEEMAVPALFIIDQSKRIRFEHIGESVVDRPSASDLIDEIDKLK